MLIHNPNAAHTPYPAELRQVMNIRRANESRDWLSSWNQLSATATPLWSLPELADRPGRRLVTLATAAAGCAVVAGAFGATVVLPVI